MITIPEVLKEITELKSRERKLLEFLKFCMSTRLKKDTTTMLRSPPLNSAVYRIQERGKELMKELGIDKLK